MHQDILITDLTRMSEDKVCIAGVTRQGVSVRPDIPFGIREYHLYKNGSVIVHPRAVVQMHLQPNPHCQPPHIEDHDWLEPETALWLRQVEDDVWRLALERTDCGAAADIFETTLYENRKVKPGTGARSLGTIRVRSIDRLQYEPDAWDDTKCRYRLSFTDLHSQVFDNLSITDLALRCYADHWRTQKNLSFQQVETVLMRHFWNAEIWLRLGLTRPFRKSRQDEEWCYLQVNGVYTIPDYLEGKCFADFL